MHTEIELARLAAMAHLIGRVLSPDALSEDIAAASEVAFLISETIEKLNSVKD